jgi:predicted amidophosphoribosyltransferase
MTRQYFIRAPDPDRGETPQTCPICHKEAKEGDNSCPGCGYKFPKKDRRPNLHHESLISFPHSADSGPGKESIFLL